ncbi:cytochrome b5 reductase 4-like isoform X2 [Rhynchophorus ferrugineus]|uniref:cytochrome b5 reductase 4-like isoform X2 n=1 Tax=Rhynchophorus ferrugineus TaxID=354439 RepID=UPI003FCDE1FF
MFCKLKLTTCCCWNWKSQSEVSDDEIKKDATRNVDLSKGDDNSTTSDNDLDEEGNPRNKVALQPGHSLMDWIRLGTSGKDLTGLGSRGGNLSVTKLELARHNTMTDAWTAIRGRVYNITEYLAFHPGGEDELMRGAGIDATRLFEEVHPWVNYEQILQKCYVGKLVSVDPSVDTEALFFGEKNQVRAQEKPQSTRLEVSPSLNSSESSTETNGVSPNEEKIELPRFDWIQKLEYITIIFYTKAFSNPLVEIQKPTNDRTLVIALTYYEHTYKNELTFFEKIHWPCDVTVTAETGKVELVFRKHDSGVWDNYGVLKQQTKLNSTSSSQVRSTYLVKRKSDVNYNTVLLQLEREDEGRIVVPVGRHVRVFAAVDGEEFSRSYTPVPDNLFDKFLPHCKKNDSLCLMVKRYSNGKMSRYITDKDMNDYFSLSRPFGGMELKTIEKRETFLMLAGGTGITPMLSLILFLLERRIKKCQFIRLLFFNRTEKDILFKTQLASLAASDQRLKINNILSEPNETWTGEKGHVNSQLIQDCLEEHLKDTGYTIKDIFVFICGPPKFNDAALQQLHDLSMSSEQIKKFEG